MIRKMTWFITLVMISILMLSACSGGGKATAEAEEEYRIIEYPQGSLIVVQDKDTGLYGGVDAKGKLAAPCRHSTLEYIGTSNYGDQYIAVKDGKYGFVNGTGEEVIPCEYDYITPPATIETTIPFELTDDLVVIEKDGKKGYCSLKDGAVVIEPTYTYANCFNGAELAAADTSGNLTGYINRDGDMVIPEKYTEAGDFEDGYAIVRDEKEKIGVIDIEGKTVIPFKYDDFYEYFDNGYAVVMEEEEAGDGCRYIAIDQAGNEIFSSNNQICMYGNLFAEYVDEYCVLYDQEGKKLSEDKYSELVVMCEGADIITYDMDENEGLMDCDGKVLLPCKYNRINDVFHDADTGKQLWEVRFADDGYCLLINERGEEIPTGDYTEIGRFSEKGLAPVIHEGKVGFIDLTGKEVIPCEYYPATTWSGTEPEEGFMLDSYNLSAVRKDGEDHYAIMDADGKVVTDYIYSFVGRTTPGSESEKGCMSTVNVLVVKDDGDKYGVVDLKGKEIVPCGTFAAVGEEFDNGLILIQRPEDKLWCLMSPDGEIVTEPVFERIIDMGDEEDWEDAE